jgi:hypothetical protein
MPEITIVWRGNAHKLGACQPFLATVTGHIDRVTRDLFTLVIAGRAAKLSKKTTVQQGETGGSNGTQEHDHWRRYRDRRLLSEPGSGCGAAG